MSARVGLDLSRFGKLSPKHAVGFRNSKEVGQRETSRRRYASDATDRDPAFWWDAAIDHSFVRAHTGLRRAIAGFLSILSAICTRNGRCQFASRYPKNQFDACSAHCRTDSGNRRQPIRSLYHRPFGRDLCTGRSGNATSSPPGIVSRLVAWHPSTFAIVFWPFGLQQPAADLWDE